MQETTRGIPNRLGLEGGAGIELHVCTCRIASCMCRIILLELHYSSCTFTCYMCTNSCYRTLHCVPLSITAVKDILPLDISYNSIYSAINKSTDISYIHIFHNTIGKYAIGADDASKNRDPLEATPGQLRLLQSPGRLQP